MADDVKPEVIKKTQDVLGKYFKKPPLTEKLLRKPPFRFLHDIISTIINETGFLDGLFTEEELNSENIKNKEAKLAYLTKLIDVVKLTTNANLTVRASKIVSGQEPTKTNELLQAIGKALDKKISSEEAIEHYKKNLQKSKSTSRGKSSVEKGERKTSKEVPQKRITTAKEKSTEQKKRISSATVQESESHRNENQEAQRNIEVTRTPQTESLQDKIPSSGHRRKSSAAKSKQNTPPISSVEKTPVQVNASTDKKEDENKKHKEVENKSKQAMLSEHDESQNHMPDTVFLESKNTNNIESDKINESKEKTEYKDNEMINSEISSQNTEKPDNVTSEAPKSQLENIDIRPRTSLRPPSARPISARPAAPRIRGKQELIINEEIMTPMGNISVIVENSDTKEDDAEDMVVMETRGSGGDSLDDNSTYKVDEQLTQEHGHLVAQILETQKELVNNENIDVMPKKTNIAWDTNSKRDVVSKEIDKLRNTIQTLTRATNPLGKLLDYFQEDVEIMQKELLEWRNQYQQVNEQLKIEKIKTQELIEPMKETLKEIDHNMEMQLDKICQAKSQIMKNDQRIQTLLNGHV
ncbi:TRAF3-interacting protein 1 [Hylaeus anthracinus]|uniref:TRAF3-interacting protein 1 n=1 Tax=Hylaeus anthracinus TaxID=313031 RepID=UPI0023B9D501|nr:TRAF3-interacting protein 1 [Hylaeus anthracinus]